MAKPLLLKKPNDIFVGLSEKFQPGMLVHIGVPRAIKRRFNFESGRSRGWFVGLGISLQPCVTSYGFPWPYSQDCSHVLYVLYRDDIYALFYHLKKRTGKMVYAMDGETWRHYVASSEGHPWEVKGILPLPQEIVCLSKP